MNQVSPEYRPEGTAAAAAPVMGSERRDCSVCGYHLDAAGLANCVTFPCHVRAYLGESFRVWRCPTCRTIHCLNVVDLAHYYAHYPFAGMQLTWPFRVFYRHLTRRLLRHGLTRKLSLLDYGCGDGVYLSYLHGRGFDRACGYDPYGRPDKTGNPAVLRRGPFDFIFLQDVLEHVENPLALLTELNRHLAPGGCLYLGTPNAERIDLTRPEDFWNEVHVPYHLHIYTRQVVEDLGRKLGWSPVGFYDRAYHDRPWLGLNNRAAKQYQRLVGGTLDAVLEPIRPLTALTSPKFLFYSCFGYWLSFRSDMSIVFRKPIG
jgi:SAM-dependent methyltransferase